MNIFRTTFYLALLLSAVNATKEQDDQLIKAAEDGDEGKVRELLEAGADIEARNDDDQLKYARSLQTPLIVAAQGGKEAVVKVLLKHGADMEARDIDDTTPFIAAAMNDHKGVAEILLGATTLDTLPDWKKKESEEPCCVICQDKKVTHYLVPCGHQILCDGKDEMEGGTCHDINNKCPICRTAVQKIQPLEVDPSTGKSYYYYHTKTSKIQSEHPSSKANMLKAADDLGKTALIWAVESDHKAIVKFLLEAGADTEQKTKKAGRTALITAAKNGDDGAVKVLLDAGADPKATDRDDRTALIWAAKYSHTTVVSLLLEAGADPNAADDVCSTALIEAAWKGYTAIVSLLLAAGAKPNLAMVNGKTALKCAQEKGHDATAAAILEAAAAAVRDAPEAKPAVEEPEAAFGQEAQPSEAPNDRRRLEGMGSGNAPVLVSAGLLLAGILGLVFYRRFFARRKPASSEETDHDMEEP